MTPKELWIEQIPDDDLGKLLDGLSCYMLFQSELYGRLMDEKWRRHSKPLPEWPLSERQYGPPIHDLQFILYCHKATSAHDSEHNPTRFISEMVDYGRGPKEQKSYECSCGIRDNDSRHQFGIDNECRAPGPIWWPTKKINGVVHYGVCPDAEFADDPAHSPSYFDTQHDHYQDPENRGNLVRCICRKGYVIGPFDKDGLRIGDANWMPAH